jgi:hypothetical protein
MSAQFAASFAQVDYKAYIAYNPVDEVAVAALFQGAIPELRSRGYVVIVNRVTGLETPKLTLNSRMYVGVRPIEAAVKSAPSVRPA